MSLLHVAVLGPPEVFHDESRLTFSLRKAQALLLYLAVEKGLHPRGKLAALLWPDSEVSTARTALSNAIALLRSKLAEASSAGPSHLLSQQDLLGLDPQAQFWLDLDVVQQAYLQAQPISTVPPEPKRACLVSTLQHALELVRGPFLDGFWLREETPFDDWVQQQQQQWQVRVQLLCDRLSSWQQAGGELESAAATLTHWLGLDPLSEKAYRRLMRVHVGRGDATAALQVYATCRARLAEELQVEPSADTVALAERIRTRVARRSARPQVHPVLAQSRAPSELLDPFIGRKAAFSQLMGSFQQICQGHPQAVFVMGEAGIGKTRLANEFMAWARAQGADTLSGHAFELGAQLPYQPLVEALRRRLEEENAPEDLLEELWLAELARLLPELHVRYPDLPAPTQDELTGRLRLFEAVARLLDALAKRAPLVLLVDDLHWLDGPSLELVRYLGRYWIRHGTRVLLLCMVRREGLELHPQLSAQLADLGRDLPITQVSLQALSQVETRQLVEAIVGEQEPDSSSAGERQKHSPVRQATPAASSAAKTPLLALVDFLFAYTGGQPLYLLETLKLLRDRGWLQPRQGANGLLRLWPTRELAATIGQEQFRRELVPLSVRALIQARLAKLSQPARQLVMASAVLGKAASAQRLWQMAGMGTLLPEQAKGAQAGVEALEEALASGILRQEVAGGPGVGRADSYGLANELMREVISSELSQARRQILQHRALALLSSETAQAKPASGSSQQARGRAMSVLAVEDTIGLFPTGARLAPEAIPLQ